MGLVRCRGAVFAAVIGHAVCSGGCAATLAGAPPESIAMRESATSTVIGTRTLELHLASPPRSGGQQMPLVVYASGDGGWFGSAVGMFRTIARSGFPTIGFSTRALMNIEHARSRPLTIASIVAAYQRIVDGGRRALGLPDDTPIILTGWSRGASLGVLVAHRDRLDPRLLGVVAVGLPADERLGVESGSDDSGDEDSSRQANLNPAHARSLDTYPLLADMAPLRCAVIQASHDGYLPAARARQLFGPDLDTRKLVTIEARNHRFDGGELAFTNALRDSIIWVAAEVRAGRPPMVQPMDSTATQGR